MVGQKSDIRGPYSPQRVSGTALSPLSLNNKEKIFNAGNGSAQKVISKTALSKIKIKIPKNKQLIQDLEQTFNQIETLQTEVKKAEELYKKYIKDLSEEAIPNK